MAHGPIEHLTEEDREIHLPDPSFAPVIISAGITLVCLGLISFLPLIVLGGALFLGGIVLWLVEDARVFVQHGDAANGHGGH